MERIVDQSVVVDVPLPVAYGQWTQFKEFPTFMKGLKQVEQLDVARIRWVAEFGGHVIQWTSEITEQLPDKRITWRSTEGVNGEGVVEFEAIDDAHTKVRLWMDYEASGVLENAAALLGVVSHEVEANLNHFKAFIEQRGTETGAWRGTIEDKSGHEAGLGYAGGSTGTVTHG